MAAPWLGSAQSNIVFNGSFEEEGAGWSGNGIGVYVNQGAAEGNIHITVEGVLYQELQTVPGRDYVLSYASHRSWGPSPGWNGLVVPGLTNFADVGFLWNYRYCYVRAESNVTQLRFEGTHAAMDDVRVYWVQDPIRILTQPQSRSAFEGGTVTFLTKADGAPPLRYQWLFNDTPIAGATNGSFSPHQLRLAHTGSYAVVISNSWNSITSEVAELQVTVPPTSPEIVSHPTGDLCPAGYGFSFQLAAVGEIPLSYQWFRDGSPLPDATNASLSFSAAQATDAGTYSVIVSNQLGTVLSLPAILSITNTMGGGRVWFDTATNNAAIYDVDGATRLDSNYLAQIYAGTTPGILRPVSNPIRFPTGFLAGYLRGVTRDIPDVASGQMAYIQIRTWEAVSGISYEQARASGGKFGFSSVYPTRTSGNGNRVVTQSFSMRLGQPFFQAGRLGIGQPQLGQPPQFTLTGEAGARYLVEKRQMPNSWAPFLILTNTTGTVVFSDQSQTNATMQIYRARILD